MTEEPQSFVPPPPDPGFPVPPWGLAGTILGVIPIITLLILPGLFVDPPADFDPSSLSLAARYGGFAFVQFVLLTIAGIALTLTRSGPRALGFRWRGLRPFVEGFLGGAILVGVTSVYGYVLSVAAPDAYAQMVAEQAEQMAFLAAPWPLLLAAAVVFAPLGEEIYFRGFVFAGLRGPLGFALSSGLSAALFAGIHLMWWSMPPLFFVGLGGAILFERHRSLWGALALHAAFNGVALGADYLLPS